MTALIAFFICYTCKPQICVQPKKCVLPSDLWPLPYCIIDLHHIDATGLCHCFPSNSVLFVKQVIYCPMCFRRKLSESYMYTCISVKLSKHSEKYRAMLGAKKIMDELKVEFFNIMVKVCLSLELWLRFEGKKNQMIDSGACVTHLKVYVHIQQRT